MTDDVLTILNRRAAIAAARAEAVRAGVDAVALLDSASFHDALTGLDVDDAAFPQTVATLVRDRAESLGLSAASTGQSAVHPAAGQPAAGPRQWTDDDVAKAGPQQVGEAMNAGLLRELGYGPRRRRY